MTGSSTDVSGCFDGRVSGEDDSRPVFTGIADEFRTALLDEIEATRRPPQALLCNSATGVVWQMGGGRDTSSVSSPLGSCLTTHVATSTSKAVLPFEVTIVSVEGLRVMLSVTEDFGPRPARTPAVESRSPRPEALGGAVQPQASV